MRRKISQREAREWMRRAERAENRLNNINSAFTREWPNGVHIGSLTSEWMAQSVDVSRRLGHAVFVTVDGNEIRFYGVRSGI
jgi:hypothetical protein